MNAKALKSERHHWWPKSLSQFWSDDAGIVHQLFWNGHVVSHTNSDKFGVTRNAHHIKLSDTPNPFDQSFENFFDSADDAFPRVVGWLNDLEVRNHTSDSSLWDRFGGQEADWHQLNELLECLLSLVVRSPRFRYIAFETIRYWRERMGGLADPLPSPALVNLNIRDTLKTFLENTKNKGKFLILKSNKKEFIFGDGFYHNYNSTSDPPTTPRMLVPITPNVCVLYARPTSYMTEPRLITAVLQEEEVESINEIVLVHSRDFIFYRSQAPKISEDFACNKFLEYDVSGHSGLESVVRAFTQYTI